MPHLLGIDAGTSSVKAALFDAEHGIIAEASVDCSPGYTPDGFVELPMKRYWDSCVQCLDIIRHASEKGFNNVKAVSVSSQGMTFVPVDVNGCELGNAIVAYDNRAREEAERVTRHFGAKSIFDVTGQPVSTSSFEAPKLMWIRTHQPERFHEIYKILMVHDYIVYRLTGEFTCVPPLLSSSLLFNIRSKSWWRDMLDFIGLPDSKLPRICEPGEPVGTVVHSASGETGIPVDAIVVAGALDQVCGMIGVGNTGIGGISESTGSFLAVHTASQHPFPCMDEGIHTFCNALDNSYVYIAVCPTAGSAFSWFSSVFCEHEKERAFKEGKSVFELLSELADNIPAGSNGLIVLPHLSGRGSPHPDESMRGMFYGMTLHHEKSHFVRALMESVGYMIRRNIEVYGSYGIDTTTLLSFGGAARSTVWNQMKADICGMTVVPAGYSEPGCLGAAILAGVGSGVYTDLDEGCSQLVTYGHPFEPDTRVNDTYEKAYRDYCAMNDHLTAYYAHLNND